MIINPLEAHDRLEKFKSKSEDISQTCQDIINQRPFGNHPFYIFSHKREIGLDERISMFNQDLTAALKDLTYKRRWNSMEEVPNARIIWQPRLTKPRAQTNSMLFKAYPGQDIIKVIWMIPPRELFSQYGKDKLTENPVVCESIYDFENNRAKLEAPEDDDLNDDQIDAVYKEIQTEARMKKVRQRQFTPLICL
jgi:hypothetical protein